MWERYARHCSHVGEWNLPVIWQEPEVSSMPRLHELVQKTNGPTLARLVTYKKKYMSPQSMCLCNWSSITSSPFHGPSSAHHIRFRQFVPDCEDLGQQMKKTERQMSTSEIDGTKHLNKWNKRNKKKINTWNRSNSIANIELVFFHVCWKNLVNLKRKKSFCLLLVSRQSFVYFRRTLKEHMKFITQKVLQQFGRSLHRSKHL